MFSIHADKVDFCVSPRPPIVLLSKHYPPAIRGRIMGSALPKKSSRSPPRKNIEFLSATINNVGSNYVFASVLISPGSDIVIRKGPIHRAAAINIRALMAGVSLPFVVFERFILRN